MRSPFAPIVALLALATPVAAQSITPLVQDGDVVPGVGAVTSIQNLAVDSAGSWIVEVDTDTLVTGPVSDIAFDFSRDYVGQLGNFVKKEIDDLLTHW